MLYTRNYHLDAFDEDEEMYEEPTTGSKGGDTSRPTIESDDEWDPRFYEEDDL